MQQALRDRWMLPGFRAIRADERCVLEQLDALPASTRLTLAQVTPSIIIIGFCQVSLRLPTTFDPSIFCRSAQAVSYRHSSATGQRISCMKLKIGFALI